MTNPINAFATSSHIIGLSAGLVETASDPSDLQGVIAHEVGHIAAGHHVSGREAAEDAKGRFLLGAAAGLLLSGITKDTAAFGAAAAISGDAAQKGLLAHSRANEQAADQAAVNYLRKAEQSPAGVLRVMRRLERQKRARGRGREHLQPHPPALARPRRFLERAVAESPWAETRFPAAEEEALARIQAKLSAYRDPQAFAARLEAQAGEGALAEGGGVRLSAAGRYGRAVALWRFGRVGESAAALEELIAEEPGNPYFHELLGQVEHGRGRIAEAAQAYREAVRLAPEAPLLRLGLAVSLVDLGGERDLREALLHLSLVRESGEAPAFAWRMTGIAEARLGNEGRASLALAELRLLEGAGDEAEKLALAALESLPEEDAPSRLRAEDVLAVLGRLPPPGAAAAGEDGGEEARGSEEGGE